MQMSRTYILLWGLYLNWTFINGTVFHIYVPIIHVIVLIQLLAARFNIRYYYNYNNNYYYFTLATTKCQLIGHQLVENKCNIYITNTILTSDLPYVALPATDNVRTAENVLP